MIKLKMIDEDWKYAKTKCVSCRTELMQKDFPQNGNYCKKCNALAKAMSDARKNSNEQLTKERLNMVFIHYERPDLVDKESIMEDLKLIFI